MNFHFLLNMKSYKKFFKRDNLMLFMLNKRGQGLSVNAIILIALGVFILAIMIIGFMVGWNRILPFLDPINVDEIIESCAVMCSTQSEFGFCFKPLELNDGEKKYTDTCNNFKEGIIPAVAKAGDTEAVPEKDYTRFKIKPCPAITC